MLRDAEPSSAVNTDRRKQPLVMDVRNDYEWDSGHFSAAARPLEVCHSNGNCFASPIPVLLAPASRLCAEKLQVSAFKLLQQLPFPPLLAYSFKNLCCLEFTNFTMA